MTLVECRPIGVFEMHDGEDRDEKVVAVAMGDPNYNFMFDISQLPEHLLEEIRHFFTVYKELESRKTVVSCAQNREKATRVIGNAICAYHEKFGSEAEE